MSDGAFAARRSTGFLSLMFTLVVGACTAAGAYFAFDNLYKSERRAVESRFALAVARVGAAAERAASLGISLNAQSTLGEVLVREAALDTQGIRTFDVVDAQGRTLFSSDERRVGRTADRATRNVVEHPIRNDLGQTVGRARLEFDASPIEQAGDRLARQLLALAWPAILAAVAVSLGFGAWLSRRVIAHASDGLAFPGRGRLHLGFRGSLTALSGVVLCVALGWIGWQAQRVGESEITPDLEEKARSVARASAALVETALDAGVPFDRLQGLDEHFAGVRAANPEIAAMSLRASFGESPAQRPAGESGGEPFAHVVQPIEWASQRVGELQVRVDGAVVAQPLRATMIDMAFLGVVALLMALELMALLVGSTAARALNELEARLSELRETPGTAAAGHPPEAVAAVRPSLFLFMLAEELTRPFIPGHARSLAPEGGAYVDLWGSLPLVVFLATVALCQVPFAATSRALGRREGFALGALIAATGYGLAALTTNLAIFTLARLMGAIGFALVFVSAQGQVIDGSTLGDRARSLAVFVRAILVAGLCGPPVGGMIADRWGIPMAFAVCAVLSLLAMAAALASLPRRDPTLARTADIGLRDLPVAWHTPGIRGLLVGCALPAKLILAALCFYLVPMQLQSQGYSGAAIGRMMMIYPLMMVIAVPLFAAVADRLGQRRGFVIWGGLLAGACSVLMLFDAELPAMALMLLLLGIGQAMSITPQSALVADLSDGLDRQQSAGVLGLFRLVERSGSAIGPALGALLLGSIGFAGAVASVGAVVLAGNAWYAWTSRQAPPTRLATA